MIAMKRFKLSPAGRCSGEELSIFSTQLNPPINAGVEKEGGQNQRKTTYVRTYGINSMRRRQALLQTYTFSPERNNASWGKPQQLRLKGHHKEIHSRIF